jgi:hypothetical protein
VRLTLIATGALYALFLQATPPTTGYVATGTGDPKGVYQRPCGIEVTCTTVVEHGFDGLRLKTVASRIHPDGRHEPLCMLETHGSEEIASGTSDEVRWHRTGDGNLNISAEVACKGQADLAGIYTRI